MEGTYQFEPSRIPAGKVIDFIKISSHSFAQFHVQIFKESIRNWHKKNLIIVISFGVIFDSLKSVKSINLLKSDIVCTVFDMWSPLEGSNWMFSRPIFATCGWVLLVMCQVRYSAYSVSHNFTTMTRFHDFNWHEKYENPINHGGQGYRKSSYLHVAASTCNYWYLDE